MRERTAWSDSGAWHRAPARLAEHAPRSLPPETLLNAAEASRHLGYKNSNQVTSFVSDYPGYFPDVEERGTAENPYRRQGETLQAWMAARPGRGRRRAGLKEAPPLPDVPVDGDPDERVRRRESPRMPGAERAPASRPPSGPRRRSKK